MADGQSAHRRPLAGTAAVGRAPMHRSRRRACPTAVRRRVTPSPFGRRQRRPRGARIPVTIVTGFLGAGKTTLIRALLRQPEGANTALVINEYGEIGIDNALLRASSDATVLLGNGCLCCTVRSDLQESLRALFADRARGAVPSFRRVVIETSGLADPGPVLQTFASDRALGRGISPAGAGHGHRRAGRRPQSRERARGARAGRARRPHRPDQDRPRRCRGRGAARATSPR